MAIPTNLQCKIFELHLEGQTAFAISKTLEINYRTAVKYTDAIDLILDKIKTSVAYCILAQMKQNSNFSTE